MANIKSEPDMPPPSSQSHFDAFQDFKPDHDAPFDDEFARLASSQDWLPGSQVYTQERTIAMRSELKMHYFSQSQQSDAPLTPEEELQGYQALCSEVGIVSCDTTKQCKRHLNKTLVNIIDLIDARRTMKKVKVWQDFHAFRTYTLQDEHRINREEAKKDGGYLASLLQNFGRPIGRRRGGRAVISGRVRKARR